MTQERAAPGAAKATILIVDDTPDNLAVIGGLLRPDYHVKVATSGERALRSARTEPVPDLILLDVMMPVMDGHAVLRALREMPETSDIPVIFVTALDAREDEARGLELGAVDYITKPVQPGILQLRVRTQLELKQARDLLRDQKEFFRRANEISKDVSLHALATLAEARDNETGFHIVRTQSYVEALGRELLRSGLYVDALARGKLELIKRAAPLHDVGKVGIADHILKKPGKLTPEEFETMKGHALIGAEAIDEAIRRVGRQPDLDPEAAQEALELMHAAREIAAGHHERWDGSGYPLGLAAEAIPLSARLMAVADVFDALTCERVYKTSMPYAEVVRILRAGSGTHFDPAIIDAFFRIEAEVLEISRRYADVA
jgi:putative two-component system response regulator